jgi:hypothetical protein
MKNKFENTVEKYEEKKRLQELAGVKNNDKGIRSNIKEKIDQLAQNFKNFANKISRRGN